MSNAPYIPQHIKTRNELPEKPEPLFWRLIGVTGEALVTIGLVLVLFLVWQLYWTDILTAPVQNKIISEINKELALPSAPAPQFDHGKVSNPVAPMHSANEAPPVEKISGKTASPIGLLRVPRWGDDYEVAILQGTSASEVLATGSLGHYNETAGPGQIGNFALAGHRQTHGHPLWYVNTLKIGDEIFVETKNSWLVYEVKKSYITNPEDIGAIAANPLNPGAKAQGRWLTLTTCHPLYSTAERWIIHAELKSWALRSQGVPPALEHVKVTN